MVNVNAPLPFNLTTNGNKQPRLSRLSTRSPQPSLDMERQSVASSASASASASHELDEDTRRPTLNVRIIRGGSLLARGRPITRDAATVVHDSRTEEGGESGAATAVGEEPLLSPTTSAAEREAQSPVDGAVRAAPILHLFVAFLTDFGDLIPYHIFLCLRQNVNRRGQNLGAVLHEYPARRSKSKMLVRFRAVGVIEFEPMMHEFLREPSALHACNFFSFRSHYLLYHPFIHHIIFHSHPFPHPLSLDNNFPLATHPSACIFSVFTSHNKFNAMIRL